MTVNPILVEWIRKDFPGHSIKNQDGRFLFDDLILSLYKWNIEEIELFSKLSDSRQKILYTEIKESIDLVLKILEEEKEQLRLHPKPIEVKEKPVPPPKKFLDEKGDFIFDKDEDDDEEDDD
jgi:hypothetical protein